MNVTPEQAAYSACLPGAAAVHLVFSCPHGVPLGSIQHRWS